MDKINQEYIEPYFAPINSPTFTGTPTAPTAPAGTNTTQIATTAFVLANSVVKNYKVYTALITQTGTDAPVATVLENTLGGTVVWTRSSAGQYLATLTGAFTLNKTIVFATTGWKGAVSTNACSTTVNTVSVDTYSTNDSSFRIDDAMDRSSFEIRVYN